MILCKYTDWFIKVYDSYQHFKQSYGLLFPKFVGIADYLEW